MKKVDWDNEFPETKKIMEEMCRRVGAKWEDVDPTEKDWYKKHSWTSEEQEDFIEWMVDYLYKSCPARKEVLTVNGCYKVPKKRIRKAIIWFVLDYGWTIKGDIK